MEAWIYESIILFTYLNQGKFPNRPDPIIYLFTLGRNLQEKGQYSRITCVNSSFN